MKAVYRFVTGEVTEVEVAQEVYEVLAELDRQEHNGERRETRRHISLDEMVERGRQFPDACEDSLGRVLRTLGNVRIHTAMSALLPQQYELLRKVFVEKQTLGQIASEEGVTYQAIQNRLVRAKRNLGKFLRKGL